ncbi:ACP S-malonyltransferase [Alkalicoccus chagannorensis]|uniref:ACP S-malonyltransferase n=1 Tax=Alkalicoccus chagannorensis TaxID=427072 RepID=UPI0004061DD8|nr:ACP S-malonyltransferase [Alkalicoccus chagannorensis]
MGKTAVLFPGQGSQEPGMGKALAAYDQKAADVFAEADRALESDFTDLIFHGDADELKKTVNTQPALLTAGTAIWQVLEQEGIRADYAAGHSLGEYTALTAAGALSFPQAVRAVRRRGELMEAAVPEGQGTMAAVLGLDRASLEKVTNQASEEAGLVEPANFNCPGQIVISGTVPGVERAVELAKEAGAKKAMVLQVSGPFHSSLMQPAAEKMRAELDALDVGEPAFPVIANVDASPVTAATIRHQLEAQMAAPVLWEDTIRRLVDEGVTTFIEAGPGKVLSGLVKKVHRRAVTLPVYDEETLHKAVTTWKEDQS